MSIVTQGYGDQGAIVTQGYGAGVFEALITTVVNLTLSSKRAIDTMTGKRSINEMNPKRSSIKFTKVG